MTNIKLSLFFFSFHLPNSSPTFSSPFSHYSSLSFSFFFLCFRGLHSLVNGLFALHLPASPEQCSKISVAGGLFALHLPPSLTRNRHTLPLEAAGRSKISVAVRLKMNNAFFFLLLLFFFLKKRQYLFCNPKKIQINKTIKLI